MPADPILRDWSVIDLNQEQIKIKLNFYEPLEVSQGDIPDVLLLALTLEDFVGVEGGKFPKGTVVKTYDCPRQVLSAE